MNTSRAGSNMPVLASSAAVPGHVRSLLLRRLQAFLKLIVRSKKRHTALRLPAIRRLRIAATISSSVTSGRRAKVRVRFQRDAAPLGLGLFVPCVAASI